MSGAQKKFAPDIDALIFDCPSLSLYSNFRLQCSFEKFPAHSCD